MPFVMGLTICRALVKTHGVRKRDLEQMIIARGQTLQSVRQRIFLIVRKFCERAKVPSRDYQGFERPDCPERYQHGEVLVFEDDSFAALSFQRQVVAKQARMPRCLVLLLG